MLSYAGNHNKDKERPVSWIKIWAIGGPIFGCILGFVFTRVAFLRKLRQYEMAIDDLQSQVYEQESHAKALEKSLAISEEKQLTHAAAENALRATSEKLKAKIRQLKNSERKRSRDEELKIKDARDSQQRAEENWRSLTSHGSFERLTLQTEQERIWDSICERIDRYNASCADKTMHIKKPTDEQKKFILTPYRNASVVASAGSGKSTTLAYRLVVMIAYLGIPPHEISVFSFTKNSSKDLREKVEDLFTKLEVDQTDINFNKLISTYHSKLYRLKPRGFSLFGGRPAKNNENTSGEAEDIDHENPNEVNISNADSELLATLRDVFIQEFNDNSEFKLTCERISMYCRLENQKNKEDFERKYDDLLNTIANRDALVHETVRDELTRFFGGDSSKMLPGLRFGETHEKITINYQLANEQQYPLAFRPDLFYRCGDSEIPIFLWLPSKSSRDKELVPGQNITKQNALKVRNNIVATYADMGIWLTGPKRLEKLCQRTKKYQASGNPLLVKLPWGLSYEPISELLYSMCEYAATCGKEPSELHTLYDREYESPLLACLLTALKHFWRALCEHLQKTKHVSFAQILLDLRNSNHSFYSPENIIQRMLLQSMSNVIIDEFQDISVDVVKWVTLTLNALHRQCKESSLIAVGDEWQAIYGFKGSEPNFLVNFGDYFPSEPRAGLLTLSLNFRSTISVVETGKNVIKFDPSVNKKPDVRAVSKESGFALFTVCEKPEKMIELASQVIKVLNNSGAKKDSIMLLARVTKDQQAVCKQATQLGGKCTNFTVHSAKGLEADFVVIVGDFLHHPHDLYKNFVYKQMGLPCETDYPFDEAQRNESVRLAYVALTRAKKGVIWVVTRPQEIADGITPVFFRLTETSRSTQDAGFTMVPSTGLLDALRAQPAISSARRKRPSDDTAEPKFVPVQTPNLPSQIYFGNTGDSSFE